MKAISIDSSARKSPQGTNTRVSGEADEQSVLAPRVKVTEESWRPLRITAASYDERGADVRINDVVFMQPMRWRRPRRIKILGDLFSEGVSDKLKARVFSVILQCPQHLFELTTNEAERMCDTMIRMDYLGDGRSVTFRRGITGKPPLANLWLGARIGSQLMADWAIPWLMRTPAVKTIHSGT